MTRRATHIYHWTNGNLMAFDQFGVQMPELQKAAPLRPEELTLALKAWRRAGQLSMAVRVVRGAKWDERNA